MKEILKSKLVKVGLIFCAFSFLYEYAFPVKEPFFTALLMIADICLLLFNLYSLESFGNDKTKKQAIINAVLHALIYFSLISGLIMCAAEEKASLQVLLVTLETLVYLGPRFILLLPVYRVIAESLG